MNPASYDEAAYRTQLLRDMKEREVTITDGVFVPPSLCSEPTLVVATSTGVVHIFELGNVLKPEYWEKVDRQEAPPHPKPTISFQAHTTHIYSLVFAGEHQDSILITGGDQDFRLWRWKQILSRSTKLQPIHVGHLERTAMGYRGALLPFSEINDMAMQSNNVVLMAGGDCLAHAWDLTAQCCVRQYEGHQDYLHSIQHIEHSQEILTGSEDGTIGIWDARSTRRIDSLVPGTNRGTCAPWVRTLATDPSDTWLACGGGNQNDSHGFLSMWHLPSRVPIHYTVTPGTHIHDVAFYHTDVLTVGNAPKLQKWNRSVGELLSTATSNVSSALFCVVDDKTDLIVIGGTSPQIDVCLMPGVVSFSLSTATI